MTIERDEVLEGLLDIERTIPEPAGGMKERVLERVLEAGMVPAPISIGSGGEGVSGGSVSAGNVAATSTAKLWAVAAMAFLGGSIFGAGIYHAVQDKPVVDVATAAPTSPVPPVEAESVEAESVEAESVEEPPPEPDVELEEQAPRPPRRVAPIETEPETDETAPAPESTSESELAEERALIDVARSALGRRRPASALSALERHARRFPNGHLTQERQGLFVLAYARAGRVEEARRAAEQFRHRYPRSLMNQAIDSVLNE